MNDRSTDGGLLQAKVQLGAKCGLKKKRVKYYRLLPIPDICGMALTCVFVVWKAPPDGSFTGEC